LEKIQFSFQHLTCQTLIVLESKQFWLNVSIPPTQLAFAIFIFPLTSTRSTLRWLQQLALLSEEDFLKKKANSSAPSLQALEDCWLLIWSKSIRFFPMQMEQKGHVKVTRDTFFLFVQIMGVAINIYKFLPKMVNPCGKNDKLIIHFNFAKNGWAKRSKKREAKLRVKN